MRLSLIPHISRRIITFIVCYTLYNLFTLNPVLHKFYINTFLCEHLEKLKHKVKRHSKTRHQPISCTKHKYCNVSVIYNYLRRQFGILESFTTRCYALEGITGWPSRGGHSMRLPPKIFDYGGNRWMDIGQYQNVLWQVLKFLQPSWKWQKPMGGVLDNFKWLKNRAWKKKQGKMV